MAASLGPGAWLRPHQRASWCSDSESACLVPFPEGPRGPSVSTSRPARAQVSSRFRGLKLSVVPGLLRPRACSLGVVPALGPPGPARVPGAGFQEMGLGPLVRLSSGGWLHAAVGVFPSASAHPATVQFSWTHLLIKGEV